MALTDADPAFGPAERNRGGSAVSGEGYGLLGTCSEILEKMLQTVESFGFEFWVFGTKCWVFGFEIWVFGKRCWVFGTRSWVFGSAVGEIPTWYSDYGHERTPHPRIGCRPPPLALVGAQCGFEIMA